MIVIVWIGFSIVVGVIANNRGRDWLRWLGLSLVISPLLSIILLLVLDPIQSEADQRLVDKGTHRKCPACAELVLREARKCKHCGSELPAKAARPSE